MPVELSIPVDESLVCVKTVGGPIVLDSHRLILMGSLSLDLLNKDIPKAMWTEYNISVTL